jgi:formamidopyrimidine-DNA glycosylase
MPELPEVETVRRGLRPVLEGRRIAEVAVRRADLRYPLPTDFARRLRGRTVTGIERRGKFLLINLDDHCVWLVHLGMSGRVRISAGAPMPPGPHDHVLATTEDGHALSFCDPRRFGFMDVVSGDGLDANRHLARLGPDPLGPGFTPAYLAERLAGRRSAVKVALMDQAVVAGMGNIYASESLFRAGTSPVRPAGSIVKAQAARLVAAIRGTFEDAIAAGGSSLRDHALPSGALGTFQHGFAVYARQGEPCPGCTCDGAGGGVQRAVIGGRATYYCRRRQR